MRVKGLSHLKKRGGGYLLNEGGGIGGLGDGGGANPIPTFVVNFSGRFVLFCSFFCTASIMACFAQ